MRDERNQLIQHMNGMSAPLLVGACPGTAIPVAMVPVLPMGAVNGNEQGQVQGAMQAVTNMGNGGGDCKYDDKKRMNSPQAMQNKSMNRKVPANGPHRMPVRPVYTKHQAPLRNPSPQIPATAIQTTHPLRPPQGCIAPYISRYPASIPAPPPTWTSSAASIGCYSPSSVSSMNSNMPRGPTASPPVLNTSTPTSTQSMGSAGSGLNSSSQSEQLSKTNLYIRGLTQNTTDKDLFNLCMNYGPIISTKAILDKQTNKCKGYGFVDFESPVAAEAAVKALANQGVQAQMAKVCYTRQQEQDPTNLYIANLPPFMAETELEEILSPYGTVISTRILRDSGMNSRGVGFARMDTREMCEVIISRFNGKLLAGSKDPLLVKFADGGNKKRNQFKSQEQRLWPERAEGVQLYDQSGINQNGITSQLVSPISGYQRSYSTPVSPYQLQPSTTWVHPHQYIVQQPLTPMIPSSIDPIHYGALVGPMTAQLSQMQISGTSFMTGAHPAYTGNPSAQALYPQPAHLIQSVPLTEDQMAAAAGNNGNDESAMYQQAYNQAK
ncbi:RNA-binding motif, single-stranded-interacting protein 2 isoform X3 [Parasteatoda tepidariorum]|uniref:RNA-binding motif, single-stranded-interacting protein 2 isoform X3 n=1 Tax=Parasteatoda tepidariorum TaxID=114398 RepID=UPI00077FDFDD|nr:RNA-binding motif, single-stranded-interacting protein 2 isoform X3 [Parasteatoda tepidariorum]